ncbi:sensor histidine kinase [Pelomonas sp. KK5]|uniref:sensor histidine kinase n=1 Tax=Pelomonas sp. KK5 TaxID=1855730 RepID=UPI00097C7171|nr:ATP-binding protein [Pelomonas sp. KK5]
MRWLLCLLLALALGNAGAEPVQRLDHADAVLMPDGLPEQQRPGLTLDFRWDSAFPGRGGGALYRIALPPLDPAGQPALHIERLGNQARLRLNGQPLQDLGRLGDASHDSGKLSQLVLLPPALLAPPGRPNALEIEATMQPLRGGGLSALQLGPLAEIEPQFAARRLLEQTLSAAYAGGFLLMGGLAGALWWRQRDPLYGSFSLATLCGMPRHLDRVLPVVPEPWLAWGALLAISYGLQFVLLARFIALALSARPAWLLRAIDAALVLVAALAGLSFALRQPLLWTAALLLLLPMGLATFAAVWREARHGSSAIVRLVFAGGCIALAAGAHDVLMVRMGLFGGAHHPLSPHAMFFFVLILAALVAGRYSRTVADYRALNETLSERVAEREQHLREAFEALRHQQQEQAVLNERQRIMREIHDGIGSQLVGLLNMVGRAGPEQLSEQVRLALDEMRMAVDSLQPVHSDLTTVLATLRYRLQPRLQAAGIEVVWDVAALPPLAELPPQSVLHVQRILLEAFTNVLKHARASRVTMHARWLAEAHTIALRLSDNGIGAPAGAGGGHGLKNMQARAEAIGARLRLEAAEGGGCCVALDWPQPL